MNQPTNKCTCACVQILFNQLILPELLHVGPVPKSKLLDIVVQARGPSCSSDPETFLLCNQQCQSSDKCLKGAQLENQ